MKIFAIAWKDTLVRFSDRIELLFFIILPVLFMYLLSGAGTGQSDPTSAMLVTDLDQSVFSTRLVEELSLVNTVQVLERDYAAAQAAFDNEEAYAWLVIPADYAATLLQGEPAQLELHKLPTNQRADAIERQVQTAASKLNRELSAAQWSVSEAERLQPFADASERQAYFQTCLENAQAYLEDLPARLAVTQPALDESTPDYDPAAQAAIGQLITWVFIPLLGTSGLFAYERRIKTMQRLLTTPASRATFILGTISGQFMVGLVQMVLLIVVGALIMQVNWFRSIDGVLVLMIAFGLAATAMGAALATLVKTEKQASNLSVMLGMLFGLLGGCWWPIELFPAAVRTAVSVLPTTWAMQGFTDLVVRRQGLAGILPEAGVLLGFAVVFFIFGVLRFRYE